ncbi:MAG TPA: disulfide oxidoreductase [Acidimicrobiia bacterium]|jgi:disulfide bond formation protein DsbB|nr:disulfide oxidoreductase [Acidimicrobiia bacterium]
MSNDAILVYSTTVALLALVALAASAVLIIYRLVRGPEAATLLSGKAIWLAWIVATVCTIGSLIYSEVIHFEPCRLCWFQRIAMYPMAVILLIGAIRRDYAVKYYALPLAFLGLATSTYHYLIQVFPSLEGGSCGAVSCSARYVEIFGFISIPFMAGCGFILISVLLGLYVNKNSITIEEATGV